MTQVINLPDGTKLNFPDGVSQPEMAAAIQKNFPQFAPKAAPAPAQPKPTAGQRAKSFVGQLNLPTAEKDPGFRAVEAGAVPEASLGASAKALGRFVPQAIKGPAAAAGDWLDQALGRGVQRVGQLAGKLGSATPEKRAAQVLAKDASDLPAARARLAGQTSASPLVKGAKQTTAQAAQDEGLLGLERTVRNMPGAAERAGREIATPSNQARARVLGAMAGTEEKLNQAKAARAATAENLYRQADNTYVNVDSGFRKLMERPSIQKAMATATRLAKEAGDDLRPGDLPKPRLNAPGATTREVGPAGGGAAARPSSQLQVSGKGLHYLKMALDQQIEKEGTNSLTRTQRRLITDTRQKFLDWTEERIPEYKQAREAFRQASKPINRMELMQRIQSKATSNATDVQGNKIITRNGYQNAVKQYRKELERTMTPAQLKHIDAIAKDLDNAEKVNSPFIRPSGSETFRNATSASVLSRLTGGHGVTAAATQLFAKLPAFGWLRDVPPEQVREILVDAMLDPEVANKLLAKATPKNAQALSESLQGIAKELGIGPNAGHQVSRAQLATQNASQQQQSPPP